jgi:hypothetical protein
MTKRVVAAAQVLLIFPAVLFMSALVLRQFSPPRLEPAYSAERIITWYAGRMWTLSVLLIALPLTVLVSGCLMFLQSFGGGAEPRQALTTIRADRLMRFVAAVTITAAVVLAIVGMHMLAN